MQCKSLQIKASAKCMSVILTKLFVEIKHNSASQMLDKGCF